MKILVISPCSSTQKHNKLPNRLGPVDFTSSDRLALRMEELGNYKEPAAEMYEGKEHAEIMKGLWKIRRCYGRGSVDLSIISTGYGLVEECCVIVPYDVPCKYSPVLLEKEKSDKLHTDIGNLIGNGNYDLVFFLLGRKYYEALKLRYRPFQIPDTTVLVFLIGRSYRHLVPCLQDHHPVLLNFEEFGGNYIAKGRVFKKLCKAACEEGEKLSVFEKVIDDPQQIPNIASEACNEN